MTKVVRSFTLLSLTLMALLAAPSARAVDSGDIVMVSAKGEVHFTQDGKARDLRAGGVLEPPATLRTGPDGAVELRQGTTTVSVGPDTLLEFPALEKRGAPIDRILQPRGNAFYNIGKREGRKLRVETPYLVGVIKGTQFNVAVQSGTATISLFEGLLDVRSSDESAAVDLHAGEIASRKSGDKSITVMKMESGKAPSTGSGVRPATSSSVASSSNSTRASLDNADVSLLVNPSGGGEVGGISASASVGENVGNGVAAGADSPLSVAIPGVATDGIVAADVAADPVVAGPVANADAGGSNSDTVGSADVAANVTVDAGPVAVEVGTATSVDLGAATVETSVSTSVDTALLTTETNTAAAVDLGAGTIVTAVDAGVTAPVVQVDLGVAAAVDVPAGTVDLGLTVAGVGLNLDVDLGLDDDGNKGHGNDSDGSDSSNSGPGSDNKGPGNTDLGELLDGLLRHPRKK